MFKWLKKLFKKKPKETFVYSFEQTRVFKKYLKQVLDENLDCIAEKLTNKTLIDGDELNFTWRIELNVSGKHMVEEVEFLRNSPECFDGIMLLNLSKND